MTPKEHFDIAAMTELAEAPELNCKLVEEAYSHLAKLPPDRQFAILKQIEHQNLAPLKSGEERGVKLSAQSISDNPERTVSLVRELYNGAVDEAVYIGSFVDHDLVEVRICGQLQNLPPHSPESHLHKEK